MTVREEPGGSARSRATTYRRSLTRMNYVAQDRLAIAGDANFLAGSMAHPEMGDEVRMKRVIQYLKALAAA